MTDNEKSSATAMSDNEIIKALECCQQNTVCVECPMWKKGQNCIEKMCGYALDLINRLQTDKEALIAGQETLQKALAEKISEVERLNDNLINKCIYLSDDETTEYCVDGPCPKFKTEAQIKAEAIKEFAESFKVKFAKERYRDNYVIDDEMLDNLVKEMVGETE